MEPTKEIATAAFACLMTSRFHGVASNHVALAKDGTLVVVVRPLSRYRHGETPLSPRIWETPQGLDHRS